MLGVLTLFIQMNNNFKTLKKYSDNGLMVIFYSDHPLLELLSTTRLIDKEQEALEWFESTAKAILTTQRNQ